MLKCPELPLHLEELPSVGGLCRGSSLTPHRREALCTLEAGAALEMACPPQDMAPILRPHLPHSSDTLGESGCLTLGLTFIALLPDAWFRSYSFPELALGVCLSTCSWQHLEVPRDLLTYSSRCHRGGGWSGWHCAWPQPLPNPGICIHEAKAAA